MTFHEVSSSAEMLLQKVIESENPFTEGLHIHIKNNHEELMQYKSSSNELSEQGLCKVSKGLGGHIYLKLTTSGKDYFIKKKKYEEERKMASININASNNSSVNLNTSSGQANQTVAIYTAEQHNAINEFRDEVQSSALSTEEKAEVLELLDAMEELKAKNKTSSFKALVNRVNEIVTTSNTLHAIWQGVVQLFGI